MLKAILIALCAGAAISVAPTPQAAAGQFRDLNFGQAPTRDMVPTLPDSGLSCYVRPSDDLRVGTGKLASVKYCFWNSHLMTVMGTTSGLLNSDALFETLQAKYGEGYQSNEFIPRYIWGLNSPLNIMYERNSITNDALVYYSDASLEAQWQAAEKAAAAKSASQF